MKPYLLAAALLASGFISGSVSAADYTNIVIEKDVAAPADAVWKKIGPFCALKDWLKVSCEITSGDVGFGNIGSVRRVAGRINEVLVGKTALSYTYTVDTAKDLYHGTVEVVPRGPAASKIVYTLFYDMESLRTAEAKSADRESRTKRFTQAVETMKAMAEAK